MIITRSPLEPYDHVERKIARIKVHPKYNSKLNLKHFENDLALLKFDRPVKFTPNIIPVCLPNLEQEFGNESAWATGWGDTDEGGGENTVTLRLAESSQIYLNLIFPPTIAMS